MAENGNNVKISWTVIFGAILTCIGLAIGYNVSETKTLCNKYDILQITKLDAAVYWEQHKLLQDSIEKQLTDIKAGQRELQKILVDFLAEKPMARRP